MNCFCCGQEMAKARKVKIRRCVPFPSASLGPNSAAHVAYREAMTYKWDVVCQTCYELMDNVVGAADIASKEFHLAGSSRRNRARWLTKQQYDEWRLKDADKRFLQGGPLMGWLQPIPELPAIIRDEPDAARKQALFDELLAEGRNAKPMAGK